MRKALASLPPEFATRLSNVEFVLARRPTRPQARRIGLRGSLYGLYEGIPLPRRDSGYGMVPPDKITIFWEPLVSDFPEDEQLADQVQKTVYHEIAHHFGIDESGLRRTSVR